MRRRVIITSLVMAVVLCIGLFAFTRRPSPRGNFPPAFSETEKRQIISAANRDALRQTLKALAHAQFSEARRWLLNSRKQTVRSIGQQQEPGKIWVAFGFDEATATHAYAIWSRYIMKQRNGRWVIDKGPF